MRSRIGLLFTVVALVACAHHRPADSSQSDSALTGEPPVAQPATKAALYPRATAVTLPPAPSTQPAPAVPPPDASSMAASAPISSPEPSTPPALPETPTLDSSLSTPPPAPAPPPAPEVATVPPPPAAWEDTNSHKQVVVLQTSFGQIIIDLDDVSAPRTCGNFRKLVSDGFYNQTTFHRVIPNFMIQGGDPNSKTDDRATYGQGDPGYTLPAEIKLKHLAGAVAMARLPDSVNPQRDSNGSQFFICVTDCPSLDGQYTVFGHVIKGLDVATKIANQPRDAHDDPTTRIEMEATLETKKQALAEGSASN